MADSSEEDFSDEEFDLEALRRARPFLSDDETEENLVLVGNEDKQIVLELLPLSALEELEKHPQGSTKPKELNDMTKKYDKLSEIYRPNLLTVMRKRTEALKAEKGSDDPNYYNKRLQMFRQRIAHLKPNTLVSCSSSSVKPGPSAPSTFQRTPVPPTSTTLTQRIREQLDISYPNWARQGGNSVPFEHLEETNENNQLTFSSNREFAYQPDESESRQGGHSMSFEHPEGTDEEDLLTSSSDSEYIYQCD